MSIPLIERTGFDFPGQTGLAHGKVRDIYDFGDTKFFLATDQYSAFDRNLALVPHKGALTTAASAFWFEQTEDIIQNHAIGYPDPNVTIGKSCTVLPVEWIVRGHITGVTQTALWHNYSNGQRDFGSFVLPDGLRKNQKLDEPVLTPSTKFEAHDRNITQEEADDEGLLDKDTWETVGNVALALFERGQKIAAQCGLILVDTKYEFGTDADGNLVLIDEIHTPDSSRYWIKEEYDRIMDEGSEREPSYHDKEFLRLWYKSRFNPYDDHAVAPDIPEEVTQELSNRYRTVYERLTGRSFTLPEGTTEQVLKRIHDNILNALDTSR